jgi:Lrp/AsnC family leucine-responsive transcriptional regulator
MKGYLDDIDLQILKILQRDGRITNADLAKHVDLSPPSVLQRVRALEKAGIIRGYFAHLEPERVGLKLTAWVQISLALHQEQAIERFRRAIQDLPEVLECHHVSGDADFLLKVSVRDMRQYEAFIREKLARIKGVGKIQTSFVYGTSKNTSELPF